MELFLNFGFAWLAIGLTLILSIIFMTRKMIKNASNKKAWIRLNLKLRKYHKEIGVLLIIVGLVHGLNSSMSVWTWNLGTFSWILSIILGLNWLFRAPLSKSVQWMKIHRFLTVAFVLVLILHINEVGGVQIISILTAPNSAQTVTTTDPTTTTTDPSTDTTDPTVDLETATSGEQLPYGTFTDGTYTGVATGFGNNLTVEVVIKDNTITSITILSHNERNTRYYSKAFNTVPSEIIDAQSLDVDTVSGATFSSVGIINAVNDALKDALVSGTLPTALALPTKRGH